MKYAIIIAALFVFALAQGSRAQDAQDLDQVTQALEEMRVKIAEQMTQLANNDVATQAQTWFQEKKKELDAMAPQMQEQMTSLLASLETKIEPMQEQIKPMFDNLKTQMEGILQKLTEQAKALAN